MPYAYEHIPDFFDLTTWDGDVSVVFGQSSHKQWGWIPVESSTLKANLLGLF